MRVILAKERLSLDNRLHPLDPMRGWRRRGTLGLPRRLSGEVMDLHRRRRAFALDLLTGRARRCDGEPARGPGERNLGNSGPTGAWERSFSYSDCWAFREREFREGGSTFLSSVKSRVWSVPGFAYITSPHCCEEKKEDSKPRPAADVASPAFLFSRRARDIEA